VAKILGASVSKLCVPLHSVEIGHDARYLLALWVQLMTLLRTGAHGPEFPERPLKVLRLIAVASAFASSEPLGCAGAGRRDDAKAGSHSASIPVSGRWWSALNVGVNVGGVHGTTSENTPSGSQPLDVKKMYGGFTIWTNAPPLPAPAGTVNRSSVAETMVSGMAGRRNRRRSRRR
jgi:hypothetical protein